MSAQQASSLSDCGAFALHWCNVRSAAALPRYPRYAAGLGRAGWPHRRLQPGLRALVGGERTPPDRRLATLHLSLSDASGDSAIIEYIKGRQVIHHSRAYTVMTNSPIFEQQLALESYWRQIGGTVMLPGTNRAADRFARAAFYVDAIPKSSDPVESTASVFGVIRNVSVPYGITTPDQPNISSTRWRTVSDQTRKRYYFESALSTNVFWVDLTRIDFSERSGRVKRLDLGPQQRRIYSGEANADFKEAKAFRFLGV